MNEPKLNEGLKAIAEREHKSTQWVGKKIKKEFGKSIKEIQKDNLIEIIKRDFGTKTCREIADDAGVSDERLRSVRRLMGGKYIMPHGGDRRSREKK